MNNWVYILIGPTFIFINCWILLLFKKIILFTKIPNTKLFVQNFSSTSYCYLLNRHGVKINNVNKNQIFICKNYKKVFMVNICLCIRYDILCILHIPLCVRYWTRFSNLSNYVGVYRLDSLEFKSHYLFRSTVINTDINKPEL